MSSSTTDLVSQGIAALKSGAREQAVVLLSRATALEPQHEQAWLWLSGAVTTPTERQQCLERVLSINPASPAAQRGLKLLGVEPSAAPAAPVAPAAALAGMAVIAASAGAKTAPPAPAIPAAPADSGLGFSLPSMFGPSDTTTGAPEHAAPPAFGTQPLAHTPGDSGLGFSLPSMFGPASEAAPAEAPQASPEQPQPKEAAPAAPAEAPPAESYPELDAAMLALIVKKLGESRAREHAVRAVIAHARCSWPVAEHLVREVMIKHRKQVTKSRRPRTLIIGLLTLAGGICLVSFGVIIIASLLTSDEPVRGGRAGGNAIAMIGLGIVMILGSLIGMWQDMRG